MDDQAFTVARSAQMIVNERQYRGTVAAIRRFEQALAQNTREGQQRIPRLYEIMKEDIEEEIEILRAQAGEYEAFRAGQVNQVTVTSLNDLPDVLIRARIAAGLTQKGLAQLMGLKEQQIQRYEARGYESASFARLKEVAVALGLEMRIEVTFQPRNEQTPAVDRVEAAPENAEHPTQISEGA
jgi:transcriptional regulator with XRE-family HTH domain